MNGAGVALREKILESGARAASVTIEQLVAAHAQTVFRVAYSVIRNHSDAEDVTQETFLRAVKHGRLHRIENHKAWLVKIAWRLALDRSKRISSEPLDQVIQTLPSTEEPLDQVINEQQRSEVLRKLLDTLPRDLREVVMLSTVEEMSSVDIAGVMGIPEGSVRTRLMRARAMLKQKLAAMLEKNK
jgi:RNA polymerase sigma-70 factor, ECF subfamily